LLHYARTTRRFSALAVLIGGLTAALVVAQAWLISRVVSGAFIEHRGLSTLGTALFALLAVIVGRAALAWATERTAHRASAMAKSELRRAALDHLATAGPTALDVVDPGSATVLVTTGVDALDGYFSRYLPQLFLAVIVPITIIAVVAGADWISAAIIGVTVPLVPLFMGLIGATTRDRTARRMRSLQRMGGHFLDLVAGLPTLRAFGRAKAQAQAIGEMTERYRVATMATLRLTFLSSLVLELLATVSVALVAVAVGLRLLGGHMTFPAALFVLVLAPEAYLPLRQLGANFHASADGLRAAEQVFDLLEAPAPGLPSGNRRARGTRIEVAELVVSYPGRAVPALRHVSLIVEPGETVAVTGPSGCGKSTLLSVLLGLRAPSSGAVLLGGVDAQQLDFDDWRGHLAWLPQRPHLFARTLEENVRLGRPGATEADVSAAITAAGLEPVVSRLPLGLATRLGEGGTGLSAGERQRVALARVLLRGSPLLLLDEPTANLDAETEAELLATLPRLIAGRTTLIAAHRPALIALADRMVVLPAPAGRS
jgi:thiol reductant ABC exporter CydD subunit